MKLKRVLFLAFFILTFIPIAIASALLYKSGVELSQESYTRNLAESINVQADYISQNLENYAIADTRFVETSIAPSFIATGGVSPQESELLAAFQSYLGLSEDKITACLLLDKNGTAVYTIGETAVLNTLSDQILASEKPTTQIIREFEPSPQTYSLGIVTPVYGHNSEFLGCLVSIYDNSYIFKTISSYYEIADSSTYLCRANGDAVSFRGLPDKKLDASARQTLHDMSFANEGIIDVSYGSAAVAGYYKNIYHSPWYLVGVIDQDLVYAFANRFIVVYILLILAVFAVDVILAYYFSGRVVAPINSLIGVMEDCESRMDRLHLTDLECPETKGYFETQYLRSKFLSLMRTILRVQHNFEGVYQLYQSNDMDDTNIDIDVKNQTIHSNKPTFGELMSLQVLPPEACVVERFISCFCEKDQPLLMDMFVKMRDEHLSVTREAEIYTPHLNQRWFHSLVVPMYEDDRLSHLFIQLRDISAFKKQERVSFEQARHDELTQLYNRHGFVEFVNQVLAAGSAEDTHGLLFIDMNYFKMVNDTLGHSAGDALLRTIASVLQSTFLSEDMIVSRLGGDEFAIFIPHTSQNELLRYKALLEQQLIFPYQTEQCDFLVSPSVGVSVWDGTQTETLDALIQRADTDMYRAKREYKTHHTN